MRLTATLLLALAIAVPVSAAPAPLPDDIFDVSGLSWWLGDLPGSCVAVDDDEKLCTWLVTSNHSGYFQLAGAAEAKREINLVCRVTKKETISGCDVFALNYENSTGLPRGQNVTSVRRQREKMKEEATATIESARTVLDVVALVGEAPDKCSLGRMKECIWQIWHNTPGYALVERSFGTSGHKYRLFCAFGREKSFCRTGLAD